MARDPRNVAVRRMLYRWHRGTLGSKKQYDGHVDLLLEKERNPGRLHLFEICRQAGHGRWPLSKQEVFAEERRRYEDMRDFVKSLGPIGLYFQYEDMAANWFGGLSR